MRYPVVNTQALGRATLFPQPTPLLGAAPRPAPQFAPQHRVLGQAEQASIEAARRAVDEAQGVYNRVEKTYPSLVAQIGESDAQEAWEQAKESLENAKKAFDEAVAYSQGA